MPSQNFPDVSLSPALQHFSSIHPFFSPSLFVLSHRFLASCHPQYLSTNRRKGLTPAPFCPPGMQFGSFPHVCSWRMWPLILQCPASHLHLLSVPCPVEPTHLPLPTSWRTALGLIGERGVEWRDYNSQYSLFPGWLFPAYIKHFPDGASTRMCCTQPHPSCALSAVGMTAEGAPSPVSTQGVDGQVLSFLISSNTGWSLNLGVDNERVQSSFSR